MSFWNHNVSVPQTDSGIHIQNIAGDSPEFERIYTANLSNGVSIKIVMKIFLNSMFKSGELTQSNGRWILFDPDAVADKIIDPVLVPQVEKYIEEIYALDKEYRHTQIEYIDKNGVKWRRVN
jgi:hypothetical protein